MYKYIYIFPNYKANQNKVFNRILCISSLSWKFLLCAKRICKRHKKRD